MKRLNKIARTRTGSDNIVEFNVKHGFDSFKIQKCWKYYYKKTKRNIALALHYTYKYIDQCYMDKKYSPKMKAEDQLYITNDLLNKFGELSKKHKYSYSIITSVASSFLISFLFMLLQFRFNDEPSFFEQIFQNIGDMSDTLKNSGVIASIICMPLFIGVIGIMSIVPFCILIITFLFLDSLYYSNYRNMVIPYERKVILKTLQSFDERYKELD